MKIHFSRLPFARVVLRYAFVGLTFFFFGNVSQAQNQDDFGSWFSINTQGSLSPESNSESRLRWWFDGHLRYLTDSGGFHQSIIRPGIGYKLNDQTSLWIGYGWINELPTNQQPIFDENLCRVFKKNANSLKHHYAFHQHR